MPIQDNIRLIRTQFEALSKGDIDAAVLMVDKNFEGTNVPFNTKKRGQQGFRDFLNLWFNAVPDAKIDIKNIQATEEWVVVEFTGKGRNEGPFNAPEGPIMPTGKEVELQFCELFQVRGGKVIRAKLYFDAASLMRQLGVAPELKMQA
ncbi:MAG: ester cyclase [Bacillota bacterium]